MAKQCLFLIGATGTMGFCGMKELLRDVGEMALPLFGLILLIMKSEL